MAAGKYHGKNSNKGKTRNLNSTSAAWWQDDNRVVVLAQQGGAGLE
jgi:hypothetical protein